jgi:hypothetical protein
MSTPASTTSAGSESALGSDVAIDAVPPALESRQPEEPATAAHSTSIRMADDVLTRSD